MSEKDKDLEHGVKEFLNIWQQQFEELSKDPDVTSNTLNMFQKMQENYMQAFETVSKQEKGEKNDSSHSDASFFDVANSQFHKLNKRIEKLEKRISELESGTKK